MSNANAPISPAVPHGMLRALAHRNYRIFFFGQLVSLIGTWMSSIATSWLVYRLTGSEFLLGMVAFCGQFPSFFLAPLGGVLVDRWNRQRVLIVTQCLSMLQSLGLAVLTLMGVIDVFWICALSVLQALINSFDMPARQSFVNEMVEDKADLPNAIALNSAMFNAARLLGPSLGGVVIAASSEGVCFLIDVVSFAGVMLSLCMIKIPPERLSYGRHRIVEGLIEGATYAFRYAPVRSMLLLVAAICLLGTPNIILMPVFAREILHGGPSLLGLLMAAAGCGALVGALYLAARRSVLGFGELIVKCGCVMGVSLAIFAYSREVWISIAMSFASGAAMITILAACNTVIQTLVEDNKRARVMSFYMMAFMGMMPLGSLFAGSLATHLGAPFTVLCGGISCLLIAGLFMQALPHIREKARPRLEEAGILRPRSESITR